MQNKWKIIFKIKILICNLAIWMFFNFDRTVNRPNFKKPDPSYNQEICTRLQNFIFILKFFISDHCSYLFIVIYSIK